MDKSNMISKSYERISYFLLQQLSGKSATGPVLESYKTAKANVFKGD